jgi:hypothetical protein
MSLELNGWGLPLSDDSGVERLGSASKWWVWSWTVGGLPLSDESGVERLGSASKWWVWSWTVGVCMSRTTLLVVLLRYHNLWQLSITFITIRLFLFELYKTCPWSSDIETVALYSRRCVTYNCIVIPNIHTSGSTVQRHWVCSSVSWL